MELLGRVVGLAIRHRECIGAARFRCGMTPGRMHRCFGSDCCCVVSVPFLKLVFNTPVNSSDFRDVWHELYKTKVLHPAHPTLLICVLSCHI